MTDSPTTPLRYFASHDGDVKGPFDLDMIEAFILSGHYPHDLQICAEGSKEWTGHAFGIKVPSSPSSGPPAQPVGSKPSGGIPKWVLWGGGIFGVFILMKMLIEMFIGESTSSPRSSSYTPSAPAYTTTSTAKSAAARSAANPPSAAIEDKPPFDPTKPFESVSLSKTNKFTSGSAPTPDDVVYKDLQGRSFRVSNSDYVRLSKQRDALTAEDSIISADQSKIDAYRNSLERERSYLNRTNGAEIDNFNTKIDRLNSANTELKRRWDAYNRRVDAFNSELSRVGTPIR